MFKKKVEGRAALQMKTDLFYLHRMCSQNTIIYILSYVFKMHFCFDIVVNLWRSTS